MASQIVDEAAPCGDVSPGIVPAVTLTDAQKAAIQACDFLTPPGYDAECPVSASIPFAGELLVFGIADIGVDSDCLRGFAMGLFRSATALNLLVTLRGEHDDDTPGTMGQALQGVNFLLAWAHAMAGAADSGVYPEGR